MKKNIIVLTVLLVLLILIAYFVLQRQGEQSLTLEENAKVFTFDSLSVDKIEIKHAASHLVLEKRGTDWFLQAPLQFRAEQNAVTSLIHQFKTTELKNIVSTNPEKRAKFEVDSAAGRFVTVYENGKEKLQFLAGKMGPSYTDSYIRLSRSNDVLLVTPSFAGVVDRNTKDWRDKSISVSGGGQINRLEYQYVNEKFSIELRDTLWIIGTETADANEVKNLVNAVGSLQADDFIDSSFTPKGKPTATISLSGVQLVFFDQKENFLLRTSTSPQWYVLQAWRANQILKHKKDLVKK
jgi:hypothetical protein